MTLIDSLKRLERAGAEHSRATAKLHEAAAEVADMIERHMPHEVKLPRGYIVHDVSSSVGTTTLLYRRTGEIDDVYTGLPVEQCLDYTGGRYLHGDFGCDMSGQRQTRAGSLAFARDIATGLLDDLAAFLETRTAAAEAAAIKFTEAKSI